MKILVLGTLVFALLITACQSPLGQNRSIIRVVTSSAVESIDPQTTEDTTSISALTNIYEPLIRFNTEGKIVRNLAVSWSNPSDNRWVFNLRKDVKFHKGQPFTAQDVKYSIDR